MMQGTNQILMGSYNKSFWQTKHSFEVGQGLRRYEQYVDFERPFISIPNVQVSLSSFDLSNCANQRLRVFPLNVTKNGFTVAIETWGDSKVYGVGVTWIAITS